MKKIMPVNYLTVENFERYRRIMRCFYQRHRQMQGSLYRPEVIAMMQSEYSKDYGDLEVDQDLENLVLWGNLEKQQEMIQPRSIEEYRNKNFRYQITETGVVVEEMVYQLTHVKQVAKGALDENAFRRLLKLLTDLVNEADNPVDLWLAIRSEFGQIREETANYIRYITSPEVDSRMKTEAFLVYKDNFVNYLRDFIVSVQNVYFQFQLVVKKISTIDQQTLITGLYLKEQEVPILDGRTESEVAEQVSGEMAALYSWFIGSDQHPSEYDNLMDQTNQMIAKITNLIYYFGQEIRQYQSRKKDYLHLAKWFALTDDLAESQKMYAGIFGLEHSRHFYVTEGTDATNNRENSWDLMPGTLFLNKRGRGARQERRASSFKMNGTAQLEEQEKYRQQVLRQRERIEGYFEAGLLDFSKIDSLDAASRQMFLKWISGAIATLVPNRQTVGGKLRQSIMTELDFEVMVQIDLSKHIIVECEDGQLTMPSVMMERVER
ncbi:TIGR02677 family protein [Enterococcus sp. LJL51]|uniref:TIGR02677 family protein n=1 Tax=Enterococcus sp. LJL51 TaxID=3416656 RepID=UPI003CE9C1D9